MVLRLLSRSGREKVSIGTKIRLPRPHGLRKSYLLSIAAFRKCNTCKRLCVSLQATLVRNGEFPTALLTTAGQYFASIFGLHARTETVLVAALSPRGLVCTFHRLLSKILFYPKNGAQRYTLFLEIKTHWVEISENLVGAPLLQATPPAARLCLWVLEDYFAVSEG